MFCFLIVFFNFTEDIIVWSGSVRLMVFRSLFLICKVQHLSRPCLLLHLCHLILLSVFFFSLSLSCFNILMEKKKSIEMTWKKLNFIDFLKHQILQSRKNTPLPTGIALPAADCEAFRKQYQACMIWTDILLIIILFRQFFTIPDCRKFHKATSSRVH